MRNCQAAATFRTKLTISAKGDKKNTVMVRDKFSMEPCRTAKIVRYAYEEQVPINQSIHINKLPLKDIQN